MNIKIVNHTENTTRVTNYPGTLQTFIKVHFLFFGFYRIARDGKNYLIYDKFNNEHVYTISKATKGDLKQ